MNDLLSRLPRNAQRGSKPRCHLMTHGPRESSAARLTALIAPWGAVSSDDQWWPSGFDDIEEAQLHTAEALLGRSMCNQLARWWLPEGREAARTPNWDIAATATFGARRGIVLVEAKAHDTELLKEAAGRSLAAATAGDREAREASHKTIGRAVDEARAGLSAATGLPWGISRDSHYQLSNRFAWAWKIAASGIPVALVYLGFLSANEMADKGRPFASATEWESLVKTHAASRVPVETWDRLWNVGGTPFLALIRAIEVPLPAETLTR